MNTRIVFFMNPVSFKGHLMKFFTGCYSYHCGFLLWDTMTFYDMYWMRRKRSWPDVMSQTNHEETIFKIFDSPVEIPAEYLENKILNENTHYSIGDYLLFSLRWAFHLFGKSTRNANGLICSEMVNQDLIDNNWHATYKEVPSPCDLIKALDTAGLRYQYAIGSKITPPIKTRIINGFKEMV